MRREITRHATRTRHHGSRLARIARLAMTAAACSAGAACGGDDGEEDRFPPCTEPAYGDGSCDADLACDAPDIDCYLLLPDQASADAWFEETEARVAEAEGRAARAVLPATDPRFGRARALLDQTWDAYQRVFPVGDLADHTPQMVLVDDGRSNAFVRADLDSGLAAFVVNVHSGALDQEASDDQLVGLMSHELAHVMKLHVVGEVKQGVRRYYAVDGDEPLGFEQSDDPAARVHLETWLEMAEDIGPYDHPSLAGLPLLGLTPQFEGHFAYILRQGLSRLEGENPEACAEASAYLDEATGNILGLFQEFDQSLAVSGHEEQIEALANSAMARLRDVCLAGVTLDLVDVTAMIANKTREDVLDATDPADVALVEGRHFIDGIWLLAVDRRRRMRDAEMAFAAELGVPWTDARYYSHEEEADDVTVPVLEEAGLAVDGQGGFLFGSLSEDVQADCTAALDRGVPPYGANLLDDHHATCWRVDHVDRLIAAGTAAEPAGSATALRAPGPPAPPRRRPLSIPRLPRDMY